MKEKFKVIPSYTKRNEYPVLDDKYYLIRKLGTGATSIVKLGKNIETGELVAIKMMKDMGLSEKIIEITYTAEIEALKSLSNKHIVNIKDNGRGNLNKLDDTTKIVDYIVLEYARNGELFDYVYYIKKSFNEKTAAFMFSQILDGVEAIHSAGIAHRDLKTENLLLDEFWNIKIGDFGYARSFSPGEKFTSFLGTLSYVSPEILNRTPYFPIPADIFACGVILFILVTGRFPFNKATTTDPLYKYISNSDFEKFWNCIAPHIPKTSDAFKSLINFLLASEPILRPSIIEIRKHPFMQAVSSKKECIDELEKRIAVVKSLKNREITYSSSAEENLDEEAYKNLYEDNIQKKDTELKVREFSDNLNPYNIRISCDSVVNILSLLSAHFKDCNIKFHQRSAKLTIIKKSSAIEPLIFEVEVKKLHKINEINNFWMIEFFIIDGNKKQFSEVFEDFTNKFSKEKNN